MVLGIHYSSEGEVFLCLLSFWWCCVYVDLIFLHIWRGLILHSIKMMAWIQREFYLISESVCVFKFIVLGAPPHVIIPNGIRDSADSIKGIIWLPYQSRFLPAIFCFVFKAGCSCPPPPQVWLLSMLKRDCLFVVPGSVPNL